MKNFALILAAASLLLSFSGCKEDDRTKMDQSDRTDYDLVYGLRQVMQYDPMNIDGINIVDKFDFFGTLRLTIHYAGGKISAVTFSNGNIPFAPVDFTVPTEKTEAFLDTDVLPNVIRLKESGKAIATYLRGEFIITFRLDSPLVSYKYTFKSVE
ncbi:MAG: hypothetical protein LBH06_01460 [Rikenellaceae bacterium]|jgi:hypothetical protein|nr:hypothetical protein [Rikenellaceae bacterium]